MDSKVLIINPPSKDRNINRDMAGGLGFSGGEGIVLPPLDLLNLMTSLKNNGYEVLFLDAIAERINDFNKILDLIKDEKVGIIIGNLSLPTLDEDVEFYKRVKKAFKKIKVIIKTGINYSEILKKIFKKSHADLIIFSECDIDIVDYLKNTESSGTVKKINGKIVFSKVSKQIDNLDLLPVPSRESIKNDLYKFYLIPGNTTTMQTTRGCPYPCGYYCPYPLVQGTVWRYMSAKRVLDEIISIKKLGINNILFRDATFTLDKKRTIEICTAIVKNKIKIKWWCETRINVLDEELLISMKKAGCVGINVGVETLDKELIKSEGKPGVSLEDIIEFRHLAKKIGIKLHFLMIIGLPNENLETLSNTFEYFVKLRPESAGFTLITPYPGTRMFSDAVKDGLVSNFDWNTFDGSTVAMRTKYLSQKELVFARFLLQATSYCIKRSELIGTFGIHFIRLIFKAWKKIK